MPQQIYQFLIKAFINKLKLDLIIIISKKRENMSSDQESPYALSESHPRTYSCFCHKAFTTYPGIYIHLKSKHNDLFQKYKKLKITKLLRKVQQKDGSEIYRLDKIFERGDGDYNFQQKQINLKNKLLNYKPPVYFEQDSQPKLRQNLRNLRCQNITLNPQQQESKESNPVSQLKSQTLKLAIINFFKYQMLPDSYLIFPYADQNPHFMPFSSPHSLNLTRELTIKKLMLAFLKEEAAERKLSNLKELKDSLYDLMTFIDMNYQVIPDPRIKGMIIFSYCDQFEPTFIGPILIKFIHQRQSLRLQGEEEQTKLRQINYIYNFSSWLRQIGLLESIFSNERKKQTTVKAQTMQAFLVEEQEEVEEQNRQ